MTRESQAVDDAAYHEARVLLLIDAACETPGSKGVLHGLTKLAKMDFLVRYPHVVGRVIDGADDSEAGEDTVVVDDPMIRYKYGPWDSRYYDVLGRLLGRGLVTVARGRQGALKFKATEPGHEVATELSGRAEWSAIAHACSRVASLTSAMNGSQLTNLIYDRLPDLMNRGHREVIA